MRRPKRTWRIRRQQRYKKTPARYMGLKVPLDRSIMNQEIVLQLLLRDYELAEIMAVRALVQAGDRVLELGTGLGIVSSIAARLVADGEILTYEANPGLSDFVVSLHRLNGISNVTQRHGVLRASPRGQTESFHLHQNFPEGSLIGSDHHVGTVEVPVGRFQDELSAFRPTVLLCDIEGGEAELLASTDLSGLRVVIVEIHPKVISQAAVRQIFDNLMGQGFCPRVEHTRDQVVAFERLRTESGPGIG